MTKINPKLEKEALELLKPIIEFCKDNGVRSFNMFLMGNDLSFYGHDISFYSPESVLFDVFVEGIYEKEN